MPDRIVRAGILSSEAINTLSWAGEVFYRRLISVVDDFGRYDARPAMLRSQLYPLRVDHVSDSDIGKLLTECVNAGLIRAYQVSGRPYLEVQKFSQRVRSESKWPDPPPTGATLTTVSNPPTGASTPLTVARGPPSSAAVVVDVDVDVCGTRKKPLAPRKTRCPDGFKISDRVYRWAEENGHNSLDAQFDAFMSYVRRKGPTYLDWDEALMTAIRGNWAKLSRPAPPSGKVAL